MSRIELETNINAPIERCFNLCLSVDLHLESSKKTSEKVVGGVYSKIMKLGDEITWRGKFLGIWQELSVKISEYNYPVNFCDVMTKGRFRSMKHEHHFENKDGSVLMKDIFEYEVPFSFLGSVFDKIILKNYLKKFLAHRCETIKLHAETDKWRLFLNE